MTDPIDTDAIRVTHRLPVFGDDDAGERWCHHCAEPWPCTTARLCDEVDRLRDLLAKALPWIDPNDRHEDYLLTVAIREALGEPT